MEAFRFKLEGLLKLRRFKERKIKIELGNIVKEIQNTKDQIVDLLKQVDHIYDSEESALQSSTKARMLQAFPLFIQAKKDEIEMKRTLQFSLEKKYEAKVQEMKITMGEVKVIESLKEKKILEYKKVKEKKQNEELEDLYLMRKKSLEGAL
ncbi:MAG: flagellar export protein FliJ [Halobacteriovoraceae bacterium]|jgi:flagellar protein FliJ|nr:flagellar export protein FliJ [Halobacteriovoraceae bacterium]